jgi:hypothetical protein
VHPLCVYNTHGEATLLAIWEPSCNHLGGSYASHLSHPALDDLCELAEKISNRGERAAVLDVLCGLGGEEYSSKQSALARSHSPSSEYSDEGYRSGSISD